MRRLAFVSSGLAATGILLVTQTYTAQAAPNASQYFISMRAPTVDPAPRFVAASPVPTAAMTASVAGCDGEAYYLAPGDAAAVHAAIANANTVQLQVAAHGGPAEESAVMCLIQSSQ